jgi:hypothetical protein
MLSKDKLNTPETQYCFMTKITGLELGHKSGFKNMIRHKTSDSYIDKYYKMKGITAPRDVKLNSVKIPWE